MKVILHPQPKRFLRKCPQKTATIILKKIYTLRFDPLRYLDKLSGYPLWKLRIGDYRALVAIDTAIGEVNIVKIGHRKDVYKR